jgi:hypothetical protein
MVEKLALKKEETLQIPKEPFKTLTSSDKASAPSIGQLSTLISIQPSPPSTTLSIKTS